MSARTVGTYQSGPSQKTRLKSVGCHQQLMPRKPIKSFFSMGARAQKNVRPRFDLSFSETTSFSRHDSLEEVIDHISAAFMKLTSITASIGLCW